MTRITLALSAVLCLAGCETSNSTESVPDDNVYHVTKERSGQTVSLRLGQVLAVVLPSVAGAPSHWTPVVSDPTVLVQRGPRATLAPRSGGVLIGGTAGHERIEFQTRASGVSTVRASRTKSQREGGGTATFEITVVVN